jgi:glycosyltransferase involved in cell wall biosynthesis
MLFSVLVANYNNSPYLTTAISSVLQQTYANWEIILVDDGSTDEFEQIIAAYTTDKRIRVFRNAENQGCGFTKRACIENASGDILGFLDPDDALVPEALAIMIKAHREYPHCSLISSTHFICDEQLQVRRIADYPKPIPAGIPYLLLSDGRIHHFASFKKDRYQTTPGLSPDYKKAVDQDLYYKLEEAGEVMYINQPLYFYRLHAGSISNFQKRHEATLWHYAVIEEACLRRIKTARNNGSPGQLIKQYKTRYYKIRIFHSFRRRKWLSLIGNLLIFPFIGGFDNMVSYCRKLPKEGISLLRRSFTYDHEIK